MAVSAYRFYALDPVGRVLETRDLGCEDDHAAEAVAERLLGDLPHVHAVEVWIRPRLVSRIAHEPMPSAASARVAPPKTPQKI